MPNPCKEWKVLSDKLHKCTGKRLLIEDCRTEQLFGKREDTEVIYARYLAFSPEDCKTAIKFLSKRSVKDTLEFRISHQLDDANRYNGRGEDMETEYTATYYYNLLLTIKTPTGREKAKTSFFV